MNLPRLCIPMLLALSAGVALAQPPTTCPAGALPAVVRAPEYAASAHVSERMINEQAGMAIVLPSEPRTYGEEPLRTTAIAKTAPEPRPLPEGYVIARRPARIERQASGYLVRVEPDPRLPEVPPLQVLPNARLALLETALAEIGADHRFMITGRVTEFQDSNYLLLTSIAELPTQAEESPRAAVPLTPAPEAAAGTKPAGQTETRPAGPEPTAEELIRQMMQDRPPRSAALPEPRRRTATAPAQPTERPLPEPPETERAHWADDTMLSDRPVRLVPGEGGGWMLAFEDAGKRPADAPIRVLPGRVLETAISLTAGGTKPVVLVVSGEITAHNGCNYILLRKVLVRRNLGNLG